MSLKDQNRLLHELLDALEESKATYMLTGALLMKFYGDPRATGDIDLIIESQRTDINVLSQSLKRHGFVIHSLGYGHNTILHKESSKWADLIIRELIGEEIAHIKIMGRDVCVSTPENLILKKLDWMGEEYAGRDASDVISIFVRMGNRLKIEYIVEESRKRGLVQRLQDLLRKYEIGI
ncbi:MAG: hypothetical protein QXU32_06565 [Nitrososphaerales archaeon]